MDEGVRAPSVQGTASQGRAIPWRRVLVGALAADTLFGLLLALVPALSSLAWAAGLVFFALALWVGRNSHRPWRDGFLYGSFAALPAAAALALAGFPGKWALGFAFLLAWPQGVAGAWVGKKALTGSGDR